MCVQLELYFFAGGWQPFELNAVTRDKRLIPPDEFSKIPCDMFVQAAGRHVKGFAPSLDILHKYRVCLAPLRFGAGLKGKILDSWAHGLPVCTTPVGAEGMFPATSHTPEGFPDTQVRLT